MAIVHAATSAGLQSAGTTLSISYGIFGTIVADDLLFIFMKCTGTKVPIPPASFALLWSDTTTSAARCYLFVRNTPTGRAVGGESAGAGTLTCTGTGTWFITYTRYTGANIVVEATSGSATGTASTSLNVTAAGVIGLTAGDTLLTFIGFSASAGSIASQAVTATGITAWGTTVEQRDYSSISLTEYPVVTGTATGAPNVTATIQISADKTAIFVRLREAPVGATLTGTLSDATLASTAKAIVNAGVAATIADATLSATASGNSDVGATLSVTLDNAALTSGATVPLQATVSRTLADASLTSTATALVQATLSATLQDATLVSTAGAAPVGATFSATLADATLTSTGTIPLKANVSTTLADATLSSAASIKVQASVTTTLANATIAATASIPVRATVGTTLQDATLASSATATLRATVTATLADATLASAATAPARATLAVTLGDATLASTASALVRATLAATLADATLDAVATIVSPVAATLSVILDGATLTATATIVTPASSADIRMRKGQKTTLITIRGGIRTTRISFSRGLPMSLHIGDEYVLPFEIVDNLTQDHVDPETFGVFVKPPTGAGVTFTQDSPNIVKTAVGRYRITIPITEAGSWRVVVNSPGPANKGREQVGFEAMATVADGVFA